MTEYILLGFLMQNSMTGYDIKQHMSMSTSYFIDASFGSIYPALKRLEQKGFILIFDVHIDKVETFHAPFSSGHRS
ncbi:PadR family transcriptional regulator [Desulfosporosinus sp. FKA]|uniref:PadR family transcriptional regulator n=1 Tax=Desulfosporosinus sp. FKA TaxID=1969834 RepID=UPI000B49A7EE|nr:PadR family transcriptional regulator [Desulfosporosinus sp. FKA]